MSNFKYTFFDNQLIGVDHLNEITKRLVTGGVSAVYSGADFDVSGINNSNMAILCGGVVPESDLNLKVVSLGNGRFLINQGVCFFDDGTTMEVLSGGEEIAVALGVARYVYLTSDKNQMKCFVEITDSEKQSGVFQLLAYIDEAGSVHDRRVYARGKVPGFYGSNAGKTVNITEEYGFGDLTGATAIEVPVGDGNFSHLCIVCASGDGSMFYCEFENGVSKNQFELPDTGVTSPRFNVFSGRSLGQAQADKNVKIENGKLIIPLYMGSVNSGQRAVVSYHLW
jgi:hypothetical protein